VAQLRQALRELKKAETANSSELMLDLKSKFYEVLLAGCGGSPSSSGGSPGAGGSTSSPSAVAYSACMRSHGIPNFPDPTASHPVVKEDPQQLGGVRRGERAQDHPRK